CKLLVGSWKVRHKQYLLKQASAFQSIRVKPYTWKLVALISSLINFVLSLVLWANFDFSYYGFQFVTELSPFVWGRLGLDGISIFFVLLTTFTIPICILSSWDSIKVGIKYFLMNFLILETLLIAVFIVLDLLLFYICFESTLIPMFLIIGIFGHNETRIRAAYLFFLYTLLGSLFMLLAILVMYFSAGSTDFSLLETTEYKLEVQKILWAAIFFAFAIKTPLVPFHIWLPLAHTEAPLAGSVVLAGIILKLAGYGMLRVLVGFFPEASGYFTPLVYTFCVISIIYTSLTILRQIDLKSIIAYSSVGHMAIAVLGIFSNSLSGIEGSILLMLAHGIVSPALFICVGVLYDLYHTRNMKYYRGLVLHMPVFVCFFFVFILANMATPLTANFMGETLTFMGAFKTNPVLTALGATSIVLSAAYSIWFFNRVSFGAQSIYIKPTGDLNRREFMLLLSLLLLTLLPGIFPNLILDPLHVSVSNLLHSPPF
ncbi:NADH dehydrogenase subunit 4, partial [Endogone sp. FLAS-F59071]